MNVDLTVRLPRHPEPGETLLGSGGELTAGGKGANQAVAAGLLGADVCLIGAVGSDPAAEVAMSSLERSGVSVDSVASVEGATGLAVITVADRGENTIAVVPGANSRVDGSFVRERADVVASSALTLLQGEIPASGFAEAVRLSGGRVVVNLAPVVPVDLKSLLRADPLVVNEHEAALALALFRGDVTEREPESLAGELIREGCASVVVTVGARGAVVADPRGTVLIPAPEVKAVDTTGCGDAFVGALVTRLADGDSLLGAVRFAVRVGSYAAMGPGAQDSYPSLDADLPEVSQ